MSCHFQYIVHHLLLLTGQFVCKQQLVQLFPEPLLTSSSAREQKGPCKIVSIKLQCLAEIQVCRTAPSSSRNDEAYICPKYNVYWSTQDVLLLNQGRCEHDPTHA